MSDSRLPPLELLEANHMFPGRYVFKIIGVVTEDFETRIIEVLREELGLKEAPQYSTRKTSGDKHIAITTEVEVQSAAMVHVIYERLIKEKGVVVLL
jgi:uncharacterized protein